MTLDALRLLLAGLAGAGSALLWFRTSDAPVTRRAVPWRRWLELVGLGDVDPTDLAVSSATAAAAGLIGGQLVFGAPAPALLVGLVTGAVPAGTHRRRAAARREEARECWPAIIEEVRVLTGSAGRSIPRALFEAGARTPPDLARRFDAAHREWLVTMDFEAAVRRLQQELRDPFADALLMTLVVAHEVGGTRLDEQLRRLADDRITDLDNRRSARAEQAGVRFARRFVLVVPVGMAAAGLSIGGGRSTYQEPTAQVAALVAIGLIVVCWVWAGTYLRLPEPHRAVAR